MEKIRKLLEQIRKNPERGDLHSSLGNLYQKEGKTADAAKHFLAAARLFSTPNSPSLNLNKALAILRKMIRDFPDLYDPYFLLADTLREMDQTQEASRVYRSLSELYSRDGKYLMAVSVFDKALSSGEEDQESWIRFGELNREAGMPFHAAQALVKAASLGSVDEARGEKPGGLLIRALALDPENAEALELFRDLLAKGKVEEGREREILDLAIQVDRNGQYDQALVLLDLLKDSGLGAEAAQVAEGIRAHSGFTQESPEKELQGTRKPLLGDFQGMKVLVVEDEREILLLLEQILAGEGFNVLTAGDGEKGLEVYLRERPQLVVTDAMLPKLHGFELCRRIKEESRSAAKVMILTAVYKKYKYKGKVQEEYNVDEYLDKPFQITEFLDAVSRMARSVRKEKRPVLRQKDRGAFEAETSILLAVQNDADMLTKVTVFCDRKGMRLAAVKDPGELIDSLRKDIPDIILFCDPFEGIHTDIIGVLLRDVMENQWSTLVMVTKDRSRFESSGGHFDHRVFAPVNPAVLENIVSLHLSSHPPERVRGQAPGSMEERRLDSILRSKLDRILKSHNQLEEYYSRRIEDLEAQNSRLREKLARGTPDGD